MKGKMGAGKVVLPVVLVPLAVLVIVAFVGKSIVGAGVSTVVGFVLAAVVFFWMYKRRGLGEHPKDTSYGARKGM